MAPRRQTRNLRLSRMDAAIDAMSPYGFAENHVREVVKLLLKEYGGNEGWPFIEEFSYKELIEAILRDLEASDQVTAAEHRNPLQDKSCGDKEPPAGTSSRAPDIQLDGPQDNASADAVAFSGAAAEPTCPEFVCGASKINNAEADGKGLEDILPDQTSEHIEETADLERENDEDPNVMPTVDSPKTSGIPVSQSVNNNPSPTNGRRRLHCYGWIESDEEDCDDFLYLRPAKAEPGVESTTSGEFSKCPSDVKRKRRSRWDERPDDP